MHSRPGTVHRLDELRALAASPVTADRGVRYPCPCPTYRAGRVMSVRSSVFVTQFEGESHGNELGTGVSSRCAGSPAPTWTPGCSPRAGRWRTGSTRRITSHTRPPRRRPAGACDGANSSSLRAGAAGSGSRPPRRAARAIAASRGTSAGRARASTTCRAGRGTPRRASTRRRASGGSVRRRRPGPRSSPFIHGPPDVCRKPGSVKRWQSLRNPWRWRRVNHVPGCGAAGWRRAKR